MTSTHPEVFLTDVFRIKCFEEAYLGGSTFLLAISRFLARAVGKSCAGLAPLVISDDRSQGADGCGYVCSCPVPWHHPILISVCLEISQICFLLDVSHDFCLGKQFKYPLMCHFVWFLILHLKSMSKLYLILCLVQLVETSQHNLNLRHNSAADSHTYTQIL